MRNKDTEYRQYILEHQKNVKKAFNEYGKLLCKELGVNLGVISLQIQSHDNSKFMNPEFDLYRRKFFKEDNEQEISDYEFNLGWLMHIHNNPHHPQFWVLYDEGQKFIYDMPDNYIVEMILDWIAIGYKFNSKCYDYYNDKGKNTDFSDKTRLKVELLLEKIKEQDNK